MGEVTTLTNVKIWDGIDWSTADSLVMDGDKITALGNGLGQENAQGVVMDCAGATLVPGLIDAHVHMELNPENRKAPAQTSESVAPEMAVRAEAMVKAGITTARDLGGGKWLELTLRDQITAGELLGPRLLCSGQPITTPEGHCHFWGGGCSNLEEALEVIARQDRRGVDLIKVMATGGTMTKGSAPKDAQFDLETLTKIVERANELGYHVAAHCHGTKGIHHAAHAKVTTIEHCSWVGEEGWATDYNPEVALAIAKNGVWVSPTISRGWKRMLGGSGKTLERMRVGFRGLKALGVPFIASTDAGIPGVFHHHLPEALAVFSEIAELTTAQTMRASTWEAALAIGLGEVTGRLAPGFAADLLLLDGDPLDDLEALTRPVAVWARGRKAL